MNLELFITAHARERLSFHDVGEEEIRLVLDTGAVTPGYSGRWIAAGVLTAGYTHRGRNYRHKEVRVVYVVEEWGIAVVTVVARYGFWEGAK